MRKNQKYTQEEMYLAIELWKESGISIEKFCHQEALAVGTFKYWQLKYNREQKKQFGSTSKPFIPIQVTSHTTRQISSSLNINDSITIAYPNGIEVSCPISVGMDQLKALIKL